MTAPTGPAAAGPARAVAAAAGPRLAAILLGAACVAWTAIPLLHGGWPGVALAVSIVAVTAGALRLALADLPQPENDFLLPAPMRAWLTFLAVLRALPCDIFLGAHGSYFGLTEKYPRWKAGDRDAFVDPAGYKAYVEDRERAFEAELAKQVGKK